MKKANRATLKGGKRVNVYLDKPSLDRAFKLGKGNVSKGIRKALSPLPDNVHHK